MKDNGDNALHKMDGRYIGFCEAKFRASQYDMGLLFVMAYGLKNDRGRMIADLDSEPYIQVSNKSTKNIQANK
jgi:hypothetical protein